MRRLIVIALVLLAALPAHAQVSRPHPSATPQGDRGRGLSVPVMPTPMSACSPNAHYFFADNVGCIYACAGTARRLIAAAVAGCVLPTGVPTATPTVTVTPTVTATPTLTPTPTVTSTP